MQCLPEVNSSDRLLNLSPISLALDKQPTSRSNSSFWVFTCLYIIIYGGRIELASDILVLHLIGLITSSENVLLRQVKKKLIG